MKKLLTLSTLGCHYDENLAFSDYCLACICKAVTGCIRSEQTKCYNSDTLCGSFKFSIWFWMEGGNCTKSPDEDPTDPEGVEFYEDN